MTLSYETYLEDLVEPFLPSYLRSESEKEGKWRSARIGALVAVFGVVIILRDREPLVIAIGALVGALFCGLVGFLSYAYLQRRNIRWYLKAEIAGSLPSMTTYRIEEGRVSCESLGETITFALSDLELVTESDGYLVISYGKTGLCTIPLRAFGSDGQKAAFVALLEGGMAAPGA